ncbi:hypothetical protein WOLCODRAFT_79044 [Wolfiporia cocos MD-104 SS10]|uniref:DDE-1 domain-containing protein n=1 Tax=Wolfiporia cocos (strain MD-104) TaxID=742152 RepID=A0A2H3IYM3_WOLCO|nr:hypothetical protein WOLCODRAFT_79044 [Wolfiporia cocos MD-104 SS10]
MCEEEEESDTDRAELTVNPVTNLPQQPAVHSTQTTNRSPSPKRCKLDVPTRVTHYRTKETRMQAFENALDAIQKLIISKRHTFVSGDHSLQAYRARCIESYLHLIVKYKHSRIVASECAAKSHGFAMKWGGRMVRMWAQKWMATRELPVSMKGRHVKSYMLLQDPTVRAELRSYVRSNKWSMNLEKLAEFTKGTMTPAIAQEYLKEIVHREMPEGLKKYMELELFPQIHMKVGQGISLRTARDWLPHDGKKKSWVLDGEQPLHKKGPGRGIHCSDVICSTFGWLKDAGQGLEYGKNHDGFWNGEMFVNQLKTKIILTFKKLHGSGFQALIAVDHSQGHSTFAKDALLVSRMYMRPGGKQARMRDGWFTKNDQRVIQSMNFPSNHLDHPNSPKGMWQILIERGLWYLRDHCDYTFPTLQSNMPDALASVSMETIRKWEHRTVRWMDAYHSGLGAKDAQLQVQAFSSRHYKSHRRVLETLAHQLD